MTRKRRDTTATGVRVGTTGTGGNVGADAGAILAALLAASPQPIVVHDIDGFVRFWSPAAEALFGFTADEARALPLPILGSDARHDIVERIRAGERGRLWGLSMRRKDGQELLGALTFATVRDAAGNPVGGVGIVEPTVDDGHTASTLEAQRVDAAERAIGSIVHDLKNVLSAVRGFATVIAEDLPEDDVGRGDVEQIMKAVDRGAFLAHRLLALRGQWQAAASGVVQGTTGSQRSGRMVSGPIRPETVLITEDDDLVRLMTVKVLRRRGFSVIEASSAIEAEERAQAYKGKIDLLLTDIGLPELSGTDLAQRLKGRYPTLKILYMSGFGRTALAERGIVPGPALLEKPFAPSVLVEHVEASLAAAV